MYLNITTDDRSLVERLMRERIDNPIYSRITFCRDGDYYKMSIADLSEEQSDLPNLPDAPTQSPDAAQAES